MEAGTDLIPHGQTLHQTGRTLSGLGQDGGARRGLLSLLRGGEQGRVRDGFLEEGVCEVSLRREGQSLGGKAGLRKAPEAASHRPSYMGTSPCLLCGTSLCL